MLYFGVISLLLIGSFFTGSFLTVSSFLIVSFFLSFELSFFYKILCYTEIRNTDGFSPLHLIFFTI